MNIIRRLGPGAKNIPSLCWACNNCPDILELDTGEFAIIGRDATEEARAKLPAGVSCGGDERIVVIPREVLLLAKRDIPDC
jgi:hypothetical protein